MKQPVSYNLKRRSSVKNEKIGNLRLIKAYMTLLKEGKKKRAYHLWQQTFKKAKFVEKNDWESRSICGDFPEVDTRCLVFCCRASKRCLLRNVVLEKMGLTVNKYAQMKKKFARNFETKIDT